MDWINDYTDIKATAFHMSKLQLKFIIQLHITPGTLDKSDKPLKLKH